MSTITAVRSASPPDSSASLSIEVYTNPGSAGYGSRTDFLAGHDVPVVLDGVEVGKIAVDSILPKAGPGG